MSERRFTILATAAVAALLAAVPLGAEPAAGDGLPVGHAVLLGAVEGITEYLPVSSTGHLTVVQGLLGLWRTPASKTAADAYAICIQAGAIIAVLLVSFGRIKGMLRGLVGKDRDGLRLAGNLVVAFVPAALIGFFVEDSLKRYLFGIWPVVGAWTVGGLFILLFLARRRQEGGTEIDGLTWKTALVIGLAQVVAMWPGVSRSLATIAAALFLGLSTAAAVEFSFLLGLVTLGAATVYEGIKLGPEIVEAFGWLAPLVGVAVAAVTGFAAVRWMVGYLKKRSLAIFGWYRIAVALVTVVLVATGLLAA